MVELLDSRLVITAVPSLHGDPPFAAPLARVLAHGVHVFSVHLASRPLLLCSQVLKTFGASWIELNRSPLPRKKCLPLICVGYSKSCLSCVYNTDTSFLRTCLSAVFLQRTGGEKVQNSSEAPRSREGTKCG